MRLEAIGTEVPAAFFEPGRNCWRTDRADRFRCIQDAAECFRLVREALLAARRSVFILGWDIAATIDLTPGAQADGAPTRLDKLLAYIVRRRPELRCYILIWDYGTLFTLERDPLSRVRLGWRMPRRVRFGFDDRHPLGACHHQKIVVVDDRLAFSGSVDLTGHRWDTPAHAVEQAERVTVVGAPYGPFHEVQALVEGPVAATLGKIARDRWRAIGADRLPDITPARDPLWPQGVDPDLSDVDVAVARTIPESVSTPGARECEALFYDAIARARRRIYIENQYFTNARIGDALAARLAEPDGPEVVIVTPRDSHGWLEENTMSAFRNEIFGKMTAADRHGRLRLVSPVASRAKDVATFIHSKVMVADDQMLRIGSANCTNRSMGMDTECDLAVAPDDAAGQAGVRRVLARLIGEHAGLDATGIEARLADGETLRALLDADPDHDRRLARIDLPPADDTASEFVRSATDPEEPMGLGPAVAQVLPAIEATAGSSPLRIWILPVFVVLAAWVTAWAMSGPAGRADLRSLQALVAAVPDTPGAMALGVVAFVLAAWVLLPVELLLLAAGVVFGPAGGGVVGAMGSLAAAAAGYAAGRAIGPARIRQWISHRSYRSGRQLCARGFRGIAVLRLAAMASAGSIHLICGAARIPLRQFMAGIALGLLPAVVALAGLGTLLRWTILEPTLGRGLLAIGAALVVAAAAYALRTFLLIRQFAPTVSAHRERARFG